MLIELESLWSQYLNGSTQVTYPVAPGDIRITLLTSSKEAPTLYRVSLLIELWADRATSETKAIELHRLIELADSQYRLGGSLYGVSVDYPLAHPDPDTDLDRYQMTVSHYVRTQTL